jgi:hypothetical protein
VRGRSALIDVAVGGGLGKNVRGRKPAGCDGGLAGTVRTWQTVPMREDTARSRDAGIDTVPLCPEMPAAPASTLPAVSLLTLQFLAWLAAGPRTYADVMDAWRSTCPRQSVWEDSVIDGLVAFEGDAGAVALTALGRTVLEASQSSDDIRR